MRILWQKAPSLVRGTRRERVDSVLAIAAWFCMGAFVCSALAFYADPYLSANLSGTAPALIGGLVAAVIAMIKSA